MMGREQLERNAQVDAVAQFDFFQFFWYFYLILPTRVPLL